MKRENQGKMYRYCAEYVRLMEIRHFLKYETGNCDKIALEDVEKSVGEMEDKIMGLVLD